MTKKKHFILLLNKMCMNLKNSHPFTESAEGISVHNHHCSLVGAGPTTVLHRFTLTGFSEALVISGVVPTSAVRNLVALCLKSAKRNIFKEQMPSSGFLECGSQLRNRSIPFYWQNKICYQVVSVVLDALSAKAKRTKLLSAFSSQKRVAFVLIKNLYTGASANI